MKKQYITIFIILILIVLGIGLSKLSKKEPSVVACTMDAKLCGDGSYVGRTGPKCEFTECPFVKEGTLVRLGEKIQSNKVYITPTEVVTDSRCPVDVTCIWAGEVKVRTTIFINTGNTPVDQEIVFTMGVPVNINGKVVTLIEVRPQTKSDKVISASEYLFTFQVK